MLRFEDERTGRCRNNTRAIRRTLLRLTLQLPRSACQPTGNFSLLLTEGGSSSSSGKGIVEEIEQARQWLADGGPLIDHPDSRRLLNNETLPHPCDLPITEYLLVTRDWLMQLCELMLRSGYSISYIRRCLCQIRSDSRAAFPLTLSEFNAFLRSIVVSKVKLFADRRRQSDYVYSMSETVYENMHTYSMEYVRAALEQNVSLDILEDFRLVHSTRPYTVNLLLFSYLYIMMYHTGKRCGDVCIFGIEELRGLLETGNIAIRVPKTDRIGRLSLQSVERADEFREFLRRMVALLERDGSTKLRNFIPFDIYAVRRRVNVTFLEVYEQVTGEKKPRGLSFHSLRRRKAARFFKDGGNLETIRESLDHKDTRTTNLYINKFLLSESKRGSGVMIPSV